MSAEAFYDLFKRPEWLNLERTLIAEADGTCTNCGAAANLRIHHAYYEKDRAPWDYPRESLHALCESCKRQAEQQRQDLRRQVGRVAYQHWDQLMGYAQALEAFDNPDTSIHVISYEHAMGLGDACGVPAETVLSRLAANDTISSETLGELWESQAPRRRAALRGGA